MEERLKEFNTRYLSLSESERSKFEQAVNKLHSYFYLTGKKQETREIYYFIVREQELFKTYFEIGGYELEIYSMQHIECIILTSKHVKNKIHLSKEKSIILLILRLLYHQKLKDISLSNQVIVSSLELQEKYEQFGFPNGRLTITEMADALKLFKKYNLIDYLRSDFKSDDTEIIIYPTILYALRIDDIESIRKRLEQLNTGEALINEEFSED